MVKELKTYSSPGKLTVSIKVDGKDVDIKFEGVDVIRKRKTFITSDYKVQQALESNQAFNSFFDLMSTVRMEEEVKMESAEENAETVEPPEEKPADNVSTEENTDSTKEFDSLADAKKWLKIDLGVDVYRSMNTEKVKEAAKEKGFEIKINK